MYNGSAGDENKITRVIMRLLAFCRIECVSQTATSLLLWTSYEMIRQSGIYVHRTVVV